MLIASNAKHAKPEELAEIDPADHWDGTMTNATAHLLAAFHLLAALDTWPDSWPASLSFELAFRNLCNSLIALDDCCDAVWTRRRISGGSDGINQRPRKVDGTKTAIRPGHRATR